MAQYEHDSEEESEEMIFHNTTNSLPESFSAMYIPPPANDLLSRRQRDDPNTYQDVSSSYKENIHNVFYHKQLIPKPERLVGQHIPSEAT